MSRLFWHMMWRVSFSITRFAERIDSPAIWEFGGWIESTANDRLRSLRQSV